MVEVIEVSNHLTPKLEHQVVWVHYKYRKTQDVLKMTRKEFTELFEIIPDKE